MTDPTPLKRWSLDKAAPGLFECKTGGYVKFMDARDELERQAAELRRLEANLHEVRALLDRRPAINQGLFEAYQKWSGEVYALDWLNALDAPPAT